MATHDSSHLVLQLTSNSVAERIFLLLYYFYLFLCFFFLFLRLSDQWIPLTPLLTKKVVLSIEFRIWLTLKILIITFCQIHNIKVNWNLVITRDFQREIIIWTFLFSLKVENIFFKWYFSLFWLGVVCDHHYLPS